MRRMLFGTAAAMAFTGALVWVLSITRTQDLEPDLTLACAHAGGGDLEALGLLLEPVQESHRRRFGLKDTVRRGLIVVDVVPGSLSDAIGLEPGDLLVLVGSRAVESVASFQAGYVLGRATSLLYQRGETMHYAEIPAFECPDRNDSSGEALSSRASEGSH